jgi:hypothetical protein
MKGNEKMTKTENEIFQQINRFKIKLAFYNLIKLAANDNLVNLVKDIPYKSERVCSKGFWRELSSGERKMAGICIAHMVKHKVLNLIEVEGVHEYPKLYKLK